MTSYPRIIVENNCLHKLRAICMLLARLDSFISVKINLQLFKKRIKCLLKLHFMYLSSRGVDSYLK